MTVGYFPHAAREAKRPNVARQPGSRTSVGESVRVLLSTCVVTSGMREVEARLPERRVPVRLTKLPFAHPTMLAPMEGVTHATFRALMAARGGLGAVCTEFVRVSRAPLSVAALRREVVKAEGVPLSVQVMGNDGEKMAEAAAVVARAGADVVDVNLGCPMPRIVKKGVGAAMLKNPTLLYDVLSRMRDATPGLLSAKIRAGFDDADNVVSIARIVEKAGVDFIAVHPRRRADFYEGVADWRIITVLVDALRIPVVGNGDVWYASDILRMQRETGCAAVMVGRPALRNPWIFRQAAALRRGAPPEHPSGDDLLAFLEDVAERYAAAFGKTVGKMKELVRYVGRAVDDDRAFVTAACRLGSTEEILTLAERTLAGLPASRLDLDAHGTLALETSGSALPSTASTTSPTAEPFRATDGATG